MSSLTIYFFCGFALISHFSYLQSLQEYILYVKNSEARFEARES